MVETLLGHGAKVHIKGKLYLNDSFNPNQAGVFRSSKSRGGGGISPDMLLTSYIAVFQSNHYFMVSNENLGLQWSIEAIIILLC